MRTLHIDTGKLWRGGQRQCWLLAGWLAAEGHPTHLACRDGAPLWQAAAGSRIKCHALRPWGIWGPGDVLRLARLIRNLQPAVLAAHDAHALTLLAMAGALAGATGTLIFHRRVDQPVGRYWLSRWKLRRVGGFICVSRRIADILAADGMDAARVRTVYSATPGIAPDAAGRVHLRAVLGLKPGATLLAAIGGLIPHKGHRVLLRALADLSLAEHDLHLMLVGEGPLRAELARQAARLGIERHVHFLGERRDLALLLGAMDLLVHPSLSEGLGTSILDAFAAGIPVVATRAGGIPEIVCDGETGWLAEPGDAPALRAALAAALADPEERRRRALAARKVQRERFTVAVMAQHTLQAYREFSAAAGR